MISLRRGVMKLADNQTFNFDQTMKIERFIVGFSGFNFDYGPGEQDHHVKGIELAIDGELVGTNKIRVVTKANMTDRSGHNAKDNGKAESYINISILVFDKDEEISSQSLSALTMFDMFFEDTDHHLNRYTAKYVDGVGEAYICDDAKSRKPICHAIGKNIGIPSKLGVTRLDGSKIDAGAYAKIGEYAIFINSFLVRKKESDCHVKRTGFSVACAGDDVANVQKSYWLNDQHGPQEMSSECMAGGLLLYTIVP